jgi:hypothetical protein
VAETTSEPSELEVLATAYRSGVLSRSPTNLKEQVALLVVRGVESGLVTLDDETGLAVANTKLAMPPRSESPDELAYVTALGPFLDEYRAVEDIRFALKLGHAQWAALTALGVALPNVGAQNTLIALGLSDQLALVSQGVAPTKVLEHVRSTLVHRHGETTGLRTQPWLTGLENLFKTGTHLQNYGESSPAEWVLSMLVATDADIPVKLANPTRAQIRKANEFLRKLRVSTLKPEHQPKQIRKGPADSPWGAAVRFAGCFGVNAPAKKRNAKKVREK